MRNVVIVSPYFPPSTLAGVHRARHLAKHLPRAGWNPTVLCVDEACHEQPLDFGLARLVPETVEIVRASALSARLTRPLGVGDIGLRAFFSLKAALCSLLQERPVDVVFITGSPFYPMLLAPFIRRRFGVPVVLDFQDPWVSHWGASQPLTSKAGVSHRLACVLEPRALAYADFITSVSDVQNDQMAQRYPRLDPGRMAAIPIGCDRNDFAPDDDAALEVARYLTPGEINLSFVGAIMPRSAPLLRLVLTAFANARKTHPSAMARVRLNFIGTSNQPDERAARLVRPLADEIGVGGQVTEIAQRIPYLQALGVLARSDGLLLIGSDEPHYTASKIYPALMSGTPYVSVFHGASSAHDILVKAGGGASFKFDALSDLATLLEPVTQALVDIATAPESFATMNPAAVAPYEADAIARKFADVFAMAASHALKARGVREATAAVK